MNLNNTFEGNTDETAVSTANSGSGGDPYNFLSVTGGHAFVYDTAQAAAGSFSGRMDLAAAAGVGANYGWTYTSVGELWGWVHVYLTASPPATLRIAGWEVGGVGVGRINIATTRQVQVLDQNFAGAVNTVAAIPLNDWYRIGYRIFHSDTVGQIEAKIFPFGSDTPITDGTCITDAVRDTGSGNDRCGYGCNSGWSSSAYTFWMDNPNVNDQGLFGPAAAVEKQSFYTSRRRAWR